MPLLPCFMERLFRRRKSLETFIDHHTSLKIDHHLSQEAFEEATSNFSTLGPHFINSWSNNSEKTAKTKAWLPKQKS